MTTTEAFESAALVAVTQLGAVQLRALADRIAAGWPDHAALHTVGVAGFADAAKAVLRAQHDAGLTDVEAAAYLRGVAAGHAQQAAAVRVESVWSGPGTYRVPVRSTAQVLVEIAGEADHELLLMTYSAKPYPPLLDALSAAVGRGVAVTVVVETLQGAGSALAGAEPAAAFASVAGVRLWHWPGDRRAEPGAKMHAKIAVADRRVLLVSSANLTQSGIGKNIEAGLLVRGGAAPVRAAEHIAELRAQGALAPLRHGS
ncbi:DISARM system phospholipase D-like protein DrmC [Dactylosporangium sp. CA-139066]|uniref:DISARM system phospholipase D-like protein DrmC n=1 Tax=Dactylosporangium sp. CA-139066 TaxID=3239930 RepID=UPI003D8DCC2B